MTDLLVLTQKGIKSVHNTISCHFVKSYHTVNIKNATFRCRCCLQKSI